MFASRPEESNRRPSADFVARFKEQHFTGSNTHHLKEESDEMEYQNIAHLRHSVYDMDPTPKPSGTHFRFTPSLLDPNSSAFAAFANQPPGYYTPTPGGSTFGMQSYEMSHQTETYNTPDSLSHPNPQASSLFPSQFHPLDHQNYVHFKPQPYAQDGYQGLSVPGSVAGGAMSESSPSNYSPGTGSGAEATDPELYLAQEVHAKYMAPEMTRNQDIYGQFRFATTLHAATAMLRHPTDIPITYLNKRQAYTISVVDKSPAVQNGEMKQYRTTVRIAFDEEDQRRTAPGCWRLWKDGRGTLESGGNLDKLRAIDYEPIETRAANEKKSNTSTSLEVEESTTSFDRFTVTWSSSSDTPTVYFCVRFLFLSTDFSHSKGVKGVPVRLVAKTEYLGLATDSAFQHSPASELAYCKIKLFRDKGAERKLANDRHHLERAIDKLKQQAQQLTLGTSDGSPNKKKKRHSFSAEPAIQGSPTQRRHRREWSFSSNASALSASGNPRSQEDEIQRKLDKTVAMEAMFSSIHPVSELSLIGDSADDPSLAISPIAPQTQWDAPGIVATYPAVESDKLTGALQRSSPALSQTSFSSATSEKLGYTGSPLVHPLSPPDAPVRVNAMVASTQLSQKIRVQAATKEIDAMDVDPFYVPTPAPTIRPAICVYIAPAKIGPTGDPHSMHLPTAVDPSNDLYYAVYVPARTATSLSHSIATKIGYDPKTLVRTTIINKHGLRLLLDDEVVREMLEKQDMRVAVQAVEIPSDSQEHDTSLNKQTGLELYLAF